MISHLRGTLVEKSPTQVVVEVGGIGLRVEVPLTVARRLGPTGQSIHLHTLLTIREDDLRLYGFRTSEERSAFRALMAIRGVGARLALNLLSHLDLSDLRRAVDSGDVRALLKVPGIGRKTAQRLLLELGGVLLETRDRGERGSGRDLPWPSADPRRDAAEALVQLGYSPARAREAVERLAETTGLSADELVRAALSGAVSDLREPSRTLPDLDQPSA